MREAAAVIVAAAQTSAHLTVLTAPKVAPSVTDSARQLAALVHPGFVSEAGAERLEHLQRYVAAIDHRLTKLREKPERDRQLMDRIHGLERRFADVLASPNGAEGRWLIEELRVSLFAQHLGTAGSISEHKVVAELNRL
jgi:ATP-dependent helicase HrpA